MTQRYANSPLQHAQLAMMKWHHHHHQHIVTGTKPLPEQMLTKMSDAISPLFFLVTIWNPCLFVIHRLRVIASAADGSYLSVWVLTKSCCVRGICHIQWQHWLDVMSTGKYCFFQILTLEVMSDHIRHFDEHCLVKINSHRNLAENISSVKSLI